MQYALNAAPDASTVDLTRTRLRLCEEVVLAPQLYGEETYYHIEVPSKSQFYRIGFAEYVFVSLLDGTTSFCEALALTARALGASAFAEPQAMSMYTWLLEHNIAFFADDDPAANTKVEAPPNAAQALQKLNPFWIRIPFGRPDNLLKALQPVLGWLFSPVCTLLGVCLMVAAGLRLAADWDRFEAASSNVFATDNWLWLLVAWILLKGIHELAHGLVCQRYGGSVRETGVILAFFAPLAYVDVTSCWSFPSRWQRIHTAAAGMYVELILASVAVFTWGQADSLVMSHLLHNIIVMASLSTLLFNANPLMKFDGYYIMADLLQIPNLATQSAEAIQNLAGRLFLGLRKSAPAVTGRNVWILRIYGLAAMFWRLLISATLLIAGSVLFHGAGLVLVAAGIVAWFGMPLFKLGKLVVNLFQNNPARLGRGAIALTAFLAVVGGTMFGLPVPFSTTAPGVVTLPEGCRVRSNVSGFIDQVFVENGDTVAAGDLLLTLRNDEVSVKHADLLLEIKQEQIRHQIAMKEHDAGAAVVAKNNLESLNDRLRETDEQLAALEVRAATSGTVIARNLDTLSNTYIHEGDDLLVVDSQQQRELRISVAQEDYSLAKQLLSEQVPVRLGTRTPTVGMLNRVIPRASRRLHEPALAATDGGPLAVTAKESSDNQDESMELADQRFEAVVLLAQHSSEKLLPVGERGYVSLGNTNESLAEHLYCQTRKWLTDQIEAAQHQ